LGYAAGHSLTDRTWQSKTVSNNLSANNSSDAPPTPAAPSAPTPEVNGQPDGAKSLPADTNLAQAQDQTDRQNSAASSGAVPKKYPAPLDEIVVTAHEWTAADEARYQRQISAATVAELISRPSGKNINRSEDVNRQLHDFADQGAYATNTAAGLTAAAKIPGTKILASAGKLQESNLRKIGAAEELDNAINVFKNPAGKTAVALSESAAKYSKYIKGISFVGTALSVVDEVRYVVTVPDGDHLNAFAASAINVVGNGVATTGGFVGGAFVGSLGLPAAPVTVPVVAAAGGIGASTLYDNKIAPKVREFFGVSDPMRDQ
jgi:hypothetical protein